MLDNLAAYNSDMGNYRKALDLAKECYKGRTSTIMCVYMFHKYPNDYSAHKKQTTQDPTLTNSK